MSAYCPDGGLPRVIRLLPDALNPGEVAVFIPMHNLVLISQPVFDALKPAQQERVRRTQYHVTLVSDVALPGDDVPDPAERPRKPKH